jgi:hypothetical protein
VIWLSLSTVKDAALLEPNRTAVAPVKLRPVMVTVVPPAAGPLSGLMLLMNDPSQLGGGGICVTGGPHGGMHRWSTPRSVLSMVVAPSVVAD